MKRCLSILASLWVMTSVILLMTAMAHCREKVVLRVLEHRIIDGHSYTLIAPMLPVMLGVWAEDGAAQLSAHEVVACKVAQGPFKQLKLENGHTVMAMYFDCPEGRYRLDTIWFADPRDSVAGK